LPLTEQSMPLDDPNWIYEIKHDGFRAFAVLEHGIAGFSRANATSCMAFETWPRRLLKK
jgi:hypothetical protein